MHRYTVEQMFSKFGVQEDITDGMSVSHRTKGRGIVLTSYKHNQQDAEGQNLWPEPSVASNATLDDIPEADNVLPPISEDRVQEKEPLTSSSPLPAVLPRRRTIQD